MGDSGDEGNGGFDFDAGNTVVKALALVVTQVSLLSRLCWSNILWYMQIRMSLQAHVFFQQCCKQVNVRKLELKLWVQTRWASLYNFLDCMITLCSVSSHYLLFNDIN